MASTDLVKAKKSLTTAAKLRQDTQMIMQPYANWEEHLVPAPLTITVLGELVFISSKDDFSINRNPPKDGFKFIKYPHSFRASLMQVCNAGWSAFNEAHTSMDEIRLHTGNVPQYVRTAVEVILREDDRLFQAVLPNTLNSIDNIATECLRLSTSTKNNFESVIKLVHELIEASTNAKEAYNQDLRDVTQKIKENQIREKAKKEADKRAEEDLKNFKTKLDAAEQLFDKAMKSMPSGWDMIGMNLAEGLAQSLNTLVSGLSNVVTLNFGNMFSGKGSTTSSTTQSATGKDPEQGTEQMDKYFAVKDVYEKASVILSMIEALKNYLTPENKVDWANLYDQKNQKAKSDFQKDILAEMKNTISSLKDSDAKTTALGICNKAISICTKMAEIAPKGQCDSLQEQELVKEFEKVLEEAQTFNATAKQVTKTPPFSQKPPGLSKAQTAGQFAAENARIQIEEARKVLETARQMYNKGMERFEKNKEELTDILVILQNCDVKKIDFKTTLDILAKGLTALGLVKEQWEKMVQFFQVVTTIIKASMNTSANTFTNRAKEAAAYPSSSFLKDMVYTQAFQVSSISSLVNLISTTYVEISNKYIMDRVSSLGRLMALDCNSPEFDPERKKLQDGCVEAQKGILTLVKSNKIAFDQKTDDRLAQLNALCALLPPPTAEEEKKVKKIVNTPPKDIDLAQFD